jgi:hypothetical protein
MPPDLYYTCSLQVEWPPSGFGSTGLFPHRPSLIGPAGSIASHGSQAQTGCTCRSHTTSCSQPLFGPDLRGWPQHAGWNDEHA